ncbi:MAG: hypothetical protein ACXWNK_08510 [Vulcanimicrobiaceae bacterium]
MIPLLVPAVLAAATASPQESPAGDRAAVKQAEVERHGAKTHLDSIIFAGNYALAHGSTGHTWIHDVLKFNQGKWTIVCTLDRGAAHADRIVYHCGVPQSEAAELAMGEAVGTAAERGEFSTAARQERVLYHLSTPEMRPNEAARVQFLDQIKRQMDTGQITREQAIIKWNEFRLTTFVP